MATQNIDKVLERAAKLMAVQENRGASEAEANIAAEHLQRLLQEHNLTLSQVEEHSSDGGVDTKRVKDDIKTHKSRSQQWRVALLKGIAKNNFCLAQERSNWKTGPSLVVVGREINVKVTKMTYDYLSETFIREAREHGFPIWTKACRRDFIYFMDGATSRVIERLDQRRREAEVESAMKPTVGNSTGRELVLSDVYGSEADLNNDALNNYPVGTTAERRREQADKSARQKVEHDRLVAEGINDTVAWYRAYGYSEERSAELAKHYSRRRGGRGSSSQNWSRRDEAENRKVSSASYKAGRNTGASVGLDGQVGGGNPRRLK